jgi:dTDP-4-dehydrorhamnose 3,5-epimerase
MTIKETGLPGVIVLEPKVFRDDRGFFMETYQRERYLEAGIPYEFVQDNLSRSTYGTLRGLHLQHPTDQAKLVSVLEGEVFDVAVDVREGSPSYGRWHGERLSAENARQMLVPPGFAHGFCVVSEVALFSYKCSAPYSPKDELSVAWNDPEIGIQWPVANPTLSPKDTAAPTLKEMPRRPPYGRR